MKQKQQKDITAIAESKTNLICNCRDKENCLLDNYLYENEKGLQRSCNDHIKP